MSYLLILLVIILESVILLPLAYFLLKKKEDIFSPVIIFCAVYFLYFGMPSLIYLFYKPNFIPNITYTLEKSTFLEIIGVLMFYLGYFINSKIKILKLKNFKGSDYMPTVKQISLVSLVFIIISILSLVYYMKLVGGPAFYLTHLGETNELALGKVYFIWGILFIKLAAIFSLAFTLFKNPKFNKNTLVISLFALLSLVIVGLVGARQLIIVGFIEFVILFHYLYKKIPKLLMLVFSIFTMLFLLVYGEYRIHTFVKNRSFFSELVQTYSNIGLIGYRLTNNYFDSVQTFSTVLYYTHSGDPNYTLRYEDGKTYLALLVQPIPSKYRPKLESGNENKFFCSQGKGSYCRVISSLGELYLNFGELGIIFGMLIFGFISSFIYRVISINQNKNNPWKVIFYSIFITGIFVLVRGYFIGAGTSILMDFVPLFLITLILYFFNRAKEPNEN